MPPRPVHVTPVDAVADGIAAIRAELQLPDAFPPDVLAEADAVAASGPRADPSRERCDLPFVTIDPPGSKDLDQAMHLARIDGGAGYRVSYAIADVGAFVDPGGAIDREAHARAVTAYLPEQRVPLHPPALSEGAASLLPGVDRPAFVWQLDLDAAGELTRTKLRRAIVRSSARLDYGSVPGEVGVLLQEVGERRQAIERARGGVSLRVPEQEVDRGPDGWVVSYRVPRATEDWNAQISLLTGIAAARLMLDAGIGLLRTQPAPAEKAMGRLRAAAQALGAPWPDAQSYPEWIRTLDPAVPAHAALLHQAAGSGRGAGYTAFDGAAPAAEDATHFAIAAPYAHTTAPLRRLADRFVLELCAAIAAGTPPPQHVRDELPGLAAVMSAGTQRANRAERAVVDLVEATVLADRTGETFDAVAIDDDLVQLREPAVRAKLPDAQLPVGQAIRVRLDAADPATRNVVFTRA
ncbi:nuclease [Paraconexibacter sp. AEG42_29]|uniref:Nuclease n=1 Tax=Paraconexibacter sp. AEG42_29 TaxID=2997339 RepID=A0AAU7AYV5_9ACTN